MLPCLRQETCFHDPDSFLTGWRIFLNYHTTYFMGRSRKFREGENILQKKGVWFPESHPTHPCNQIFKKNVLVPHKWTPYSRHWRVKLYTLWWFKIPKTTSFTVPHTCTLLDKNKGVPPPPPLQVSEEDDGYLWREANVIIFTNKSPAYINNMVSLCWWDFYPIKQRFKWHK